MFPSIGYPYQRSGVASQQLTETSPAQTFVEPLSVDEIVYYLNLPQRWPPESRESTLIKGMISGARAVAETFQQRDLVRKQWDYYFDYWPAGYNWGIALRTPLVTVDEVRYRDSSGSYTVLSADTNYVVDASQEPGIIAPPYNKTWDPYVPWPSSSLRIRFTSGYSSTSAFWSDQGAQVKNGMLLLISAWYSNRIPYEPGTPNIAEYPFGISNLLSWGARNGGVRV